MAKMTLEELAAEARDNARKDREQVQQLIDKLNPIFDIDVDDPSTMQGAMLIGGHIVDLLDQKTKSNEQLVRLAQIKEREEKTNKKENDGAFSSSDLSDIRNEIKIRAEEHEEENDREPKKHSK